MCNLRTKHRQSLFELHVLLGTHDAMTNIRAVRDLMALPAGAQLSPSMLRNIRALSGSVRILYAVSGSARCKAVIKHNSTRMFCNSCSFSGAAGVQLRKGPVS